MTFLPSAIISRIAGRPSWVAGILIITFGREIRSWSNRAADKVPVVSWAKEGSTSTLTNPSEPFD